MSSGHPLYVFSKHCRAGFPISQSLEGGGGQGMWESCKWAHTATAKPKWYIQSVMSSKNTTWTNLKLLLEFAIKARQHSIGFPVLTDSLLDLPLLSGQQSERISYSFYLLLNRILRWIKQHGMAITISSSSSLSEVWTLHVRRIRPVAGVAATRRPPLLLMITVYRTDSFNEQSGQ